MNRGTLVMPTPVAFDTLAYANKLKAAGADAKVAEAQAEATLEILNDLIVTKFATKEDLNKLTDELDKFATKEDLNKLTDELDKFATKEDLNKLTDELDKFATKEDLNKLTDDLNSLRDDLDKFATKDDFKSFRDEFKSEIKDLEMRMHQYFLKFIGSSMAILVGLQTLFHFIR